MLNTSLALSAFDSAQLKNHKADIQVLGITPTGQDVPAGRELVIRLVPTLEEAVAVLDSNVSRTQPCLP